MFPIFEMYFIINGNINIYKINKSMSPATDKRGIKAYENLPCKLQRVVRKELMKQMEWKQTTLYSRIYGHSAMRQNEIAGTEKIFKKYGFNAWTGERL